MAQGRVGPKTKRQPVSNVRREGVEGTDVLVKAIARRGTGIAGIYHDVRFRDGDTFFLDNEEDFSERWMVAVDADRQEIPEETERLTKIAAAARRKAAAEIAHRRATFATEKDPVAELAAAEKELEAARAMKRAKGATKPSADGPLSSPDPKRKVSGSSDYERHEDFNPKTDAQGPEPQAGRASDKQVV